MCVPVLCKLELQQTTLNPIDAVRFARRLGVAVSEVAEPTPLLAKLTALTDEELEELAVAAPCRRLAPRVQVGAA
jgi:hypothetical protein